MAKMAPYKFLSTLSMVSVGLTYICSRVVNKKLNLYKGPKLFRFVNYSFWILINGTSVIFAKDSYRKSCVASADEQTCHLSEEYCRGGIEYYDKILRRHIALRSLLPDDKGKQEFTLKGDFFPGLIRTKERPISLRKQTCINVLKEKYQREE